MSKRPAEKHLIRILALSLVIFLAGGGLAMLYQWHVGSTSSYASSDYVVGQPSLPAATVDAIFRQMGSPMVGTGSAVEAASRAQNIDDAFALAVWWTETNDGAAGVGLADRNPGSVRGSVGYPSAYDGYTIYPSYSAAVSYWFMMMKKVYIDRGLTTVSSISHPYVGTSTSDLWAGKVITLMQRYRAEAPPKPTPTPIPTIASDTIRQSKQLAQEQQQQGQAKSTYYPPVVAVAQNAPTTTSQGLSGSSKMLLVFFNLLLALGLALWAWSINRRYAGRVRPAPAVPAASNPWEQLRASGQRPVSFFNAFSGPLPTTDTLMPGLHRTDELAPATLPLPTYTSSEALLSLGAFMAGQAQFQGAQTPPPQATPAFVGQSMSGLPFNRPANDYVQTSPMPGFGLSGRSQSTSTPAPSSFHRTRLFSPSSENVGQQPQPASVSTGGGLLSRYRQTQSQSEQEQGI